MKPRNKAKVLLINPPQKYSLNQAARFNVFFPIGLLFIAKMIKDICNLQILDCLIKDFAIQETSDYILYGTPFEKIKDIIKCFKPDIVGISNAFSAQANNANTVSKICKEIDPNVTVVFGGAHTSVRYNYLLKKDLCDFCVVGEGEKTFFKFVKNFNSRLSLYEIEGLAYKIGDTIHYKPREFIKNLDELPFPAYELINIDDYATNPRYYQIRDSFHNRQLAITTSRGCPYNCIFCATRLHMGKRFRAHSPDYVIRHIKFLMENYNIRNFHFEDDSISLNKSRFEEILDRIIEDKLNIGWGTPGGFRADSLDFNLLKKMKKSGCKRVLIAIESGNQHVLNKIIKKSSSLNYAIEITKHCQQLKIESAASYVIGFPGETIENIKDTIEVALKLFRLYDVIPHLYIATPLYGTELYDQCVKEGLINPNSLTDRDFVTVKEDYGTPPISTKEFSKKDIKMLITDYKSKMRKVEKTKLFKYRIKHPVHTFKGLTRRLIKFSSWFKGINCDCYSQD